jgi:hypothetical protein
VNKFSEPWRTVCPNGHSAWEHRATDTYRCKTCGVEFDELLDLKEDDVTRPSLRGESA